MTRPGSPPVKVVLRGDESGGHVALIETLVGPREAGPPLHVHPSRGEGFYVLEGEITFKVRDELTTGGPGSSRSLHRACRALKPGR